MNHKKYSIFIIAFAFLLSCKEKSRKQDAINVTSGLITLSSDKINEFKAKAISEGDTVAYNEIFSDYVIRNNDKDFLYYSLVMSNKSSYAKASYDVYFILTNGISKDSLKNKLDSTTYKLALEYLKKSATQGYKSAIVELEELK